MFPLYVGFIVGILFYFLVWNKDKSSSKLPPGPWGLPLLGHLLMMGDFPARGLLKWKEKYGPIILVYFGSYRTVILNDAKSIREACNDPALCDRPDLKIYKGAVEGKGLLFSDYEDNKEQRQFIAKNLRQFGLHGINIESKINAEIGEILETIEKSLGKPFRIRYAFISSVVNSVWSCLMSDRFHKDDAKLKDLTSLIRRLSELPGFLAFLGLYMPWLGKLMPELTSTNSGKEAYQNLGAFMKERIEARDDTRIPNEPRDVTDAYLDKVSETTDRASSFFVKRNFQPATSGDLFYASADTVSNNLEWTMLLLSKFENVQRKLQEEIDQIVTSSRIPALNDRPQMHYTEAVIHEVLRFASVAPFGVPHSASEDVIFQGYLIPKGTMVAANIYGAHHDPEIWPDPYNFIPERFLSEEGTFQKNPNFIVFGAGRRVCLGETLARDELFLFITRIFQKFTVRLSPGSSPRLDCKFGFVLQPDVFDVVFSERS